MSIQLKNVEIRVWVSLVEDKGNYGQLTCSTSRLDNKTQKKAYSTWYVRLVGQDSYGKISDLMEKYLDGEKKEDSKYLKKSFPIVLTSVSQTNEPYEKDGKKVFSNFQMVAWDWEFLSDERQSDKPKAKKQDDDADDTFPFPED